MAPNYRLSKSCMDASSSRHRAKASWTDRRGEGSPERTMQERIHDALFHVDDDSTGTKVSHATSDRDVFWGIHSSVHVSKERGHRLIKHAFRVVGGMLPALKKHKKLVPTIYNRATRSPGRATECAFASSQRQAAAHTSEPSPKTLCLFDSHIDRPESSRFRAASQISISSKDAQRRTETLKQASSSSCRAL